MFPKFSSLLPLLIAGIQLLVDIIVIVFTVYEKLIKKNKERNRQ